MDDGNKQKQAETYTTSFHVLCLIAKILSCSVSGKEEMITSPKKEIFGRCKNHHKMMQYLKIFRRNLISVSR